MNGIDHLFDDFCDVYFSRDNSCCCPSWSVLHTNPVLADPLQEASNEGFGRGISAGASFIFISVYCNLVRDQLLSVDEAQSHMDQLIKDSTPGLFQAELINDSAIKNDCKLTVSSP